MKNSVYALLMLFSVIAFGQEDSAETPKIAIKIPLGETVVIKGIAVKFVEVLEDSRCPTGVTCIWAGRAVVKVEVGSNGNKREKMLIFGETKRGETKDTNLYSSSEFAIKGLTLNPYPTSENSNNKKTYELLICEEKNIAN
ncbi:hypothetical protein F3C99_01035 [Vitellibacter sp. q18]|nr:hypothetical protein [Aequorivita lutea]